MTTEQCNCSDAMGFIGCPVHDPRYGEDRHQRLKDAVVEAAKEWDAEYEARIFTRIQEDTVLHICLRSLLQFESEQKRG